MNTRGLTRYDAASLSASGSFGKKVAFGVKVAVIFRDLELSQLKAILSRHCEPAIQQSSLIYQKKEIVKYTVE